MLIPLLLLLAVAPSPEDRAVAYLAREVPRWSRDNHCFSCHNNGDAARTLYAARRLSYSVPPEALADTTDWLVRPLDWDNNRGNPAASDKKLARVQFAASLAEAVETGAVADRKPLIQAAETLLAYQEADGSWQTGAEADVGSPATYGAALGTHMARRVLRTADPKRFAGPISKAAQWLSNAPAKSTLDAAAVILALGPSRPDCLDLIARGQSSDGGWGPYPRSPSEPFDTAVALLALSSLPNRPDLIGQIQQGREYLIQTQLESGGWLETTRPSGSRSYAEHISTSGWAALALISTRQVTEPRP